MAMLRSATGRMRKSELKGKYVDAVKRRTAYFLYETMG
jgi:hypothetical protein